MRMLPSLNCLVPHFNAIFMCAHYFCDGRVYFCRKCVSVLLILFFFLSLSLLFILHGNENEMEIKTEKKTLFLFMQMFRKITPDQTFKQM